MGWTELKKAFQEEFKLLRDNNETVAKIYNTKQGKNKNVRAYNCRLKELLKKMENEPADGLKKQYFIEGLIFSLRKKMKVGPPSLYTNAYNQAMEIESKNKTSWEKKASDDHSTRESSYGE